MLQFDYYRYGNSITIDVVYRTSFDIVHQSSFDMSYHTSYDVAHLTSFDFAILSVMKKILLCSNDFNNMQY